MKFKFDLKTVLIVALIVIILLMRSCSSTPAPTPGQIVKVNGKPYIVLSVKHDTTYIKHDTTIYKEGKDIYHDRIVYVNIPANVDTGQILKDYFAKVPYSDTLVLDNNKSTVVINDTISKNRIFNRRFKASLVSQSIHDTTTLLTPPVWQMYWGLTAGFDNGLLNYVGPTLMYKTKKDDVYQLSAGYSVTKSVCIQGTLLWKIRIKK